MAILYAYSSEPNWREVSIGSGNGLVSTGDKPVTGEFAAQMAGNAENVSIWWRHHEL